MTTGVMAVRLQEVYFNFHSKLRRIVTGKYSILRLGDTQVLEKVMFFLILAFWTIEISGSKLFKKLHSAKSLLFMIFAGNFKNFIHWFQFVQFHLKNVRRCR